MARKRTFDEADVVAAAREAFWTGGYFGTSLDDLHSATGLGRGSVYAAFGDKHNLFMRALDDYSTTAIGGFVHELREPADSSAFQRITTHVRSTVDTLSADTRRRGCMLAKTAAELGSTDKAVLLKVRRTLNAYQSELAAAVSLAQQEGDISSTADPKVLASFLLALLRGLEALRVGGMAPANISAAADQALLLLGG